MRIKTLEIKVYKWEELSQKAKEHATYESQVAFGYSWGDDMMKSIEALAKHFGGKVKDYEIDWFGGSYSSMSFDMPDKEEMPRKEILSRLRDLGKFNRKTLKGHGECKLTGYCGDECAIDGFRWAFYREKETDLNALMQAAFKTWLKSGQSDCEYQYSDEAMKESAEANGYEYLENGELA